MGSARRRMMMQVLGGGKEYIEFVDPAVEAICIANWSSDGIGLTLQDAAAVTSIERVFRGTAITSFDEFQYFTNVTIVTASGSTNATNGAFYNCTSLKSIVLPNSIVTIGKAAFNGCNNLESINIPDNTTTIAAYAFNGCSKLVITSLNNVTSTLDRAFTNADSLVSVTAPKLVSTSGTSGSQNSGTFGHCDNLEYVEFGPDFTTLGYRTVENCSKLKTLVFHSTTPPSFGTNAFRNCSALTHIYVPNGYGNTYKSASGWSSYSSKIYELDANGNIPS